MVVGSIPTTPTSYNVYVFENIKNYFTPQKIRQLSDIRNIGLVVFALIAVAITWSGIKTVQNNYELQKKISTLKQENSVLALQNANKTLKNQYLQTDQFLELSARQNFGLAAPGEKVLLVPKATALKYIDKDLVDSKKHINENVVDHRSSFVRNVESWRDFLLGRKLFSD